MKQYNTLYTTKEKFKHYLQENNIPTKSEKILIQVFTSLEHTQDIQEMLQTLRALFPNAVIIGAYTGGEILEGEMLEYSSVIAISVFEKSTLKAAYATNNKSFFLGVDLASNILSNRSKCCITFCDGYAINGEEYIKGLQSLQGKDNGVLIAGGMSGAIGDFNASFCIFGEKILPASAVGVSIEGEELVVFNAYNLGWSAVGPEFTVTKAQGNRVYEIDHKPVKEIYAQVFGEDVVKNLPNSAIEFPLIKIVDGVKVARSMIKVYEDGSVGYAGNLEVGERVRFGIGSKHLIFDRKTQDKVDFKKYPVQANFIYSCVARKSFLGHEMEKNLRYYAQSAPSCGFFTHGELYTGKKSLSLLNTTTTVLFLYEKGTQGTDVLSPKVDNRRSSTNREFTSSALLHFIDYVTTALHTQEESLQKSHKQTQEILDALDSVSIISKTDEKGIITYVNKAFEKISGYTKEELLGRSHNIVRSPNVSSSVYKHLWETIQAGKIWKGILENRAKDGHLYYIKSSIVPLHDTKTGRVEYLAIREDVTSIIQGKKEKERQFEFVNTILDNEESIVILMKDDKIEKVNQAFFRTFPYNDLKSFLSWHTSIAELFVNKEGYLQQSKDTIAWIEEILREPNKLHLAIMIDKNGEERIYNVKSKKIQFDSEESAYTINTFIDITEIEKAKQKAQKAEAAQAMFLANMSHEIRTPMNGILGFTELLEKTDLDLTQKRYVEMIQSSTKTLLDIINDLLDFSKISREKIELEYISINPLMELETTFEMLQTLAVQKQVVYKKSIDPLLSKCLVADPTRLRQILTNLLSNAIKFTQKGGSVELEVKVLENTSRSQKLRFAVKDNGIGISKEKQKYVFKPFAQADSSTTRQFGGTGLGLSISSTLVAMFGGELQVSSKEHEGSTFFFEIELRRCKAEDVISTLMQDTYIYIADTKEIEMLKKVQSILDSFGISYKMIENATPSSQEFVLLFEDSSVPDTINLAKSLCIIKEQKAQDQKCIESIVYDDSLASHLYNYITDFFAKKHTFMPVLVDQERSLDILVAEDYDLNQELMRSIFKQYENLFVDFANNGKEAVSKALSKRYDIIFMDINMPVLNGMDATKELRQKLSYHVPIVALTANALEGDKERFLSCGMDDYIAKPVDIEKIDRILAKYQKKRAMEKEEQQQNDLEQSDDIEKILDEIVKSLGIPKVVAKNLLLKYVESLERFYNDIRDAFAANDKKQITELVHKFKGASATLRIEPMRALMLEIEQAYKNDRSFDSNLALKKIKGYYDILKKSLVAD